MYITVKTIISSTGEIDTSVKYYSNLELARTKLIMQKDILILELLIKYTKGNETEFKDFDINKYGSLIVTDDVLEYIEDSGDYHVKYEIKCPENYKEEYEDLLEKKIDTDLRLL